MVSVGETVMEPVEIQPTDAIPQAGTAEKAFTRFVKETEPRLSYALAAAYGPEIGAEVTADAFEWAWEHWEKVTTMANPAGYLYRVGQSKARWYHRPRVLFPDVPPVEAPDLSPELPAALNALSKHQRVAVVMIHGLGYSEREVADLLGLSRWSVRTHADRGIKRLRSALGVMVDA
jgi:DNA-directed RNA polymerase specialized sigma24 family protein